jgi:hypothetical protein
MITFAAQVHQALVDAGLKIHGVSIGRKGDKTTWRVDFSDFRAGDDAVAFDILEKFDVESAKKKIQDETFSLPPEPLKKGREVSLMHGQKA